MALADKKILRAIRERPMLRIILGWSFFYRAAPVGRQMHLTTEE
jgi:hypothetical protein